ncbi:prenyltransferase [Fusibacter sp. JL216-2]|uniref:prenyltransferase n=1 Tax=Fusibacter sp. JL216-2 TaxID=3071453 RepID=UPI003D328AC4
METDTIKSYFKNYWIAMRVLSLSLALSATSFGLVSAYRKGLMFGENPVHDIFLIFIITIAGLASQAGANLVNDYFEGSFKYRDPSQKRMKFLGKDRSLFDVFVFLSGIAALGLAGLVGLYLIYITDYRMLVIGLVGLVGSYAYTGEPFVYKTKGLGVPLSFILMGPLMLIGAYFPFSKSIELYPVIMGLPMSLFVPALMISNEMRDFKRDKRLSMGTLSIRLGSRKSLLLYDTLVFGAFVLLAVYVVKGLYPISALLAFVTLPIALKGHECVSKFERLSIPYTNKLHMTFSFIVFVTLIIG